MLGMHEWDVSPSEAVEIQQRLRSLVRQSRRSRSTRSARWGGGCELQGCEPRGGGGAGVSRRWRCWSRRRRCARRRSPYVPGLLSFREIPAVLDALAKLSTQPDVLMCDGQGIAHPRRLGLASHLGVYLDRPTVGCAKSRLTGRYVEPGEQAGDFTPLTDRGELIGVVLRTKPRTKPLFVSVGHRWTWRRRWRWCCAAGAAIACRSRRGWRTS